MECTDCGHYVICKSLNNTGIFAEFPKLDFCPIFEPIMKKKVKESEEKKKNATISFNRVTSNPCR